MILQSMVRRPETEMESYEWDEQMLYCPSTHPYMQALNRRCGEYTASYPGTEMFDIFLLLLFKKKAVFWQDAWDVLMSILFFFLYHIYGYLLYLCIITELRICYCAS